MCNSARDGDVLRALVAVTSGVIYHRIICRGLRDWVSRRTRLDTIAAIEAVPSPWVVALLSEVSRLTTDVA